HHQRLNRTAHLDEGADAAEDREKAEDGAGVRHRHHKRFGYVPSKGPKKATVPVAILRVYVMWRIRVEPPAEVQQYETADDLDRSAVVVDDAGDCANTEGGTQRDQPVAEYRAHARDYTC